MNKKIREIISYYKISDRQFALKIGVSQSVIGSMFQKDTEPSAKVIRLTLAAFPEISADWFVRDVGPMLRSEDRELSKINSLIDTIAMMQDSINEKSEALRLAIDKIKQLESQNKI